MKFFGSVEPLGSSSARKYLSTCVSCFQKFKVSCCISPSSACSCPSRPYVSCPVLSCPVYIPATELLLFPPLLFPPLLFLPLFLSPTAYIHLPSPSPSPPSLSPPPQKEQRKKPTHLKLLMTIKQQNIHRLQLIHISMPLKFLSNFGSNFRHGHIERIHGLDFRCLLYPHTHTYSDDQYSFFHVLIPLHILPLSLLSLSSSLSFSLISSSQHHIVSTSKKNQTYRSQPIPITRQNSLFRITPCRGCWLPKKHPSLVFALAYIITISSSSLHSSVVG